MNTKNKILAGLFSMAALFSSCNDFQEINEDPNQVDESSRIRVGCRNGFGVNTWQIVMNHPYIVAGSRQIQTLERRLFQHRSVERIS